MNRRQLTGALVGVGGLAAAAGAWWSWQRQSGSSAEWKAAQAQRFVQPSGGEFALAEFQGKPLLLNFWATWCAPCIAELPLLDQFSRERAGKGWQVVGLAVDGPTPVREFLRQHPVGFRIGLAGMEGLELSATLGNSRQVLPFSVVVSAQGEVHDRKLGAIKPADLDRWVGALS
jgi:thiol-disulfide isomerase/thioredoxin